MTSEQTKVVSAVKQVVTDIMEKDVPSMFVFHNIDHTVDVANSVQLLAHHHDLSDLEEFALIVSAWFHDTGFAGGRIEGHEDESIRIARAFLAGHRVEKAAINLVSACIDATRMPQVPIHTVHKILCDADLYHIGTHAYPHWNSMLRQELHNYHQKVIPEEEWREQNIGFLDNHRFCTAYAQQTLEPVKQEWIKRLKNK